MPPLPSPELRSFLNSLEGFMQQMPRDLPDGTGDTIKELHQSLKGYTGTEDASPGEKEAQKVKGSDVAVPYGQAATGPDPPSPGQREHADTLRGIADALSSQD